MGWYNKGLQVDPSLVAMTGGLGKAASAFGDSLVNLGDAKIKKAEKDAADKEKLAKERAMMSATFAKNYALNPQAVQKINERYGIDPNSPAYEMSQAKLDASLIDLGEGKVKERKIHAIKPNADNLYTNFYDDGSFESTSIKAPQDAQEVKAPKQETYTDPNTGKVMIKEWDAKNGMWIKTGELAGWQGNEPSTKKTMIPVTELSPKEKQYLWKTRGYGSIAGGVKEIPSTWLEGMNIQKATKAVGNEEL